MRYYDRYRSLSDDEDNEEVDDTTKKDESEYAFEGYDIEVNEKIMLTPVNPAGNDR